MRIPLRPVPQLALLLPPLHSRVLTKTERGLVMDIDAAGDVRQGDDIDIVRGVGRGGLDRGGLDEARESLAVAVGRRVDPVADGDGGPRVGEGRVDVGLGVGVGGGGEEGGEGEGGGGGLHCCGGRERGGGNLLKSIGNCQLTWPGRDEVEIRVWDLLFSVSSLGSPRRRRCCGLEVTADRHQDHHPPKSRGTFRLYSSSSCCPCSLGAVRLSLLLSPFPRPPSGRPARVRAPRSALAVIAHGGTRVAPAIGQSRSVWSTRVERGGTGSATGSRRDKRNCA